MLLVCTYFDPVNTLLYRKARYKVADLAPVSLIAKYDYAIAAPLSLEADTFAELVPLARTEPGRLNYGQLGIASTQNMVWEHQVLDSPGSGGSLGVWHRTVKS